MPATAAAVGRLPPLEEVRLVYSGHLTLHVAPLFEDLLERGAALVLLTCNPATVDDEVVAHLRTRGARAEAWKDMPAADYQAAIDEALAWGPTHTCEMGADLTAAAHRGGETSIRAGLEATGSGIDRLQRLDLRYPVFNWDDLPIKEGLHNRYMVGLTTWQTFFERTRLSLHGRRVVVVGYGLVGRGLAATARAFGGTVSVAERDPVRRLEARYAGWETGELADLAPGADVIVTATGVAGAVDREILSRLKHGCFLLNVGHTGDEIDLMALPERRQVLPQVEACAVGAREIYLLAGGATANLAAGRGDSLNSFDVTAAVMVAAIGFVVQLDPSSWPAGIHTLPREVWTTAASDPG